MKIVNLTPHAINVFDLGGNTQVGIIPASGEVARTKATFTADGEVAGFPATKAEYGEVIGLPAPAPDTVFLVSGMVAGHPSVAGRADVVAPGDLVRDGAGNPVGCRGLKRA